MRTIVLSGFMATGKEHRWARGSPRGSGWRSSIPTSRSSARAGAPCESFGSPKEKQRFVVARSSSSSACSADASPRVIAFGGGTVTMRRARHLALDHAVVITLTATPGTIVARTGPPSRTVRTSPSAGIRSHGRASSSPSARRPTPSAMPRSRRTRADPDAVVDAIARGRGARARSLVPLGSRSYVVDRRQRVAGCADRRDRPLRSVVTRRRNGRPRPARSAREPRRGPRPARHPADDRYSSPRARSTRRSRRSGPSGTPRSAAALTARRS